MDVTWRVHFPKCKVGDVYDVIISIVILVVLVTSSKTNHISLMSCNLLPWPTKKWPWQRPSYYDQINRSLFQQQNVSWQCLEIIESLIVEAIQNTIEQGKQLVVKLIKQLHHCQHKGIFALVFQLATQQPIWCQYLQTSQVHTISFFWTLSNNEIGVQRK